MKNSVIIDGIIYVRAKENTEPPKAMQTVGIRLFSSIIDKLDTLAKERSTTRTAIIRDLIYKELSESL